MSTRLVSAAWINKSFVLSDVKYITSVGKNVQDKDARILLVGRKQ